MHEGVGDCKVIYDGSGGGHMETIIFLWLVLISLLKGCVILDLFDSKRADCADKWKAANPGGDEQIKIFKQTGIFLLAMKYGLSAVNQVLEVCGQDQAIGRDVGCVSKGTIASSSLGQKARESNLNIVVNSFHGFAHNCNFLLNNYHQALNIINKYSMELTAFKSATGFTDIDFERWHEEEKQYLSNCMSEPCEASLVVEYVELLQKLQFVEAMYSSQTTAPFLMYTPAQYTATSGLNAIARECTSTITTEYTHALRRYQLQENAVQHFEKVNGIKQRWSPDHLEYLACVNYVKHCAFIRVVEELEGLIVQRLFELLKANLASTGYKMRKHISKALTKRSTAICTALEHSHTDILSKPWATPMSCEMLVKYFKIFHSQEEIERLNVEIRQLVAWMDFNDQKIHSATKKLRSDGFPYLVVKMDQLYAEHCRINDVHRNRPKKIYLLKGFSGSRSSLANTIDGNDVADEIDKEEDVVNSDALRLSECLDRMS
ncbi:hypothetical protein OG21DRAFT_1479278 [Imleria badia]|nr:hypothetical protein OG21DRAFT_1479278 [Imleria badia]